MMETGVDVFASIALIVAGIALAGVRPEVVIRHAVAVLIGLVLVSVGALGVLVDPVAPGLRIRLDPSEEPLLPVGAATRPVYEEAVRNFGDDDLFVIAMKTDGVFTPENLSTLRRVSTQIRRLPGVRTAESLVDTTSYDYDADRDLVDVGSLIDEIPTDPAALVKLEARATGDRIYPKTIVSRNGKAAAINVSFRTMTDGEFVGARLDESIRAIVDAEESPEHAFFVTGRKHVKSCAYHLMIGDLLRLIPLAVVAGMATAWMVTGSMRSAVIPVGASMMATLWVFGFLALTDRPLNLITIVLGPMLICVGSVYGVHVLARYDAILAECGETREAALRCLRYARVPVLIAGFTTCIGFSALLISNKPAVAEFGLFSVLGIASVTFISVTGLPALLSLLPMGAAGVPGSGSPVMRVLIRPILRSVATAATERPVVVLALWLALSVVALAAIPRIVIDTDYLTFFDRHSRVRRDFASVNELIVGAIPIYVTLAGDDEGIFREPANLRTVKNLQRRIDELAGVSATLSVVDLIEILNRVVEKDDPKAERIPDSRGEVADLVFMIPKGKLRRFANSNHSGVNILVRTGATGSGAVLELERQLKEAIASEELPPGTEAAVTGNAIVLNQAAYGMARDQFTTVGFAAIAILVLIAGAFRSLHLGVLAMIPNVIPVLMFFGILGIGGATLSLPTSMIGCVALGIAIDDTAHFLVGYRHRRTQGMPCERAAADCVQALGLPIVTTSLMLVAGFLVLTLSGFATLKEFGYLSALTMFICLSADLVLLPAVLVRERV